MDCFTSSCTAGFESNPTCQHGASRAWVTPIVQWNARSPVPSSTDVGSWLAASADLTPTSRSLEVSSVTVLLNKVAERVTLPAIARSGTLGGSQGRALIWAES